MAKIQYNGAHAGNLTVEGYTFKKGVNDVNDTVLNHLHTQWMLKNKHFIIIPEPAVVAAPLAAPKLATQTQAEYDALEAAKNAKTAELAAKKAAAATVIAEAAAKKAASAK